MKNILLILSLVTACFNLVVAQPIESEQNDLQGDMELIIDVSDMMDTVGRFMIYVGGERFYPKIKNNILTVNKFMQEPRRVFLAFYPARKIKNNPGKSLNEISAGVSDHLYFLGAPGEYHIAVKNNVANSEMINASVHQKKYAALVQLKENFNTQMLEEQAPLVKEIENEMDERVRDSLVSIYYQYYLEKHPKYYHDTILGFVKYNPDAPASLFELEEYSQMRDRDLKTLSALYDGLTDRLKALPTGRRVYNSIDEESFAANNLIGHSALDFIQNDSSGHPVSLKDFKGKVTLLEFWASWCGPCRASNPALVEAYQKYNDKGFKILGVSLDDNRKNWLKAIKDDGLVWTQVSDLKGFKNTAAELYHVHSIPANFLIDESGKIIASHLDEEELNGHLEKLLE